MIDVLVFGCGEYFKQKEESISKTCNIVAIIDNFKEGEIQLNNKRSVNIFSPDKGLDVYPNTVIVIAVQNFVIVSRQLIALGVSSENILFSQNMEPYGSEAIIFNETRKILLSDNKFYWKTEEAQIGFESWDEFKNICYIEEIKYRDSLSKASYDEIDKMILNIPKPATSEIIFQNDFYSHAYWIKRFCGINETYYIKAAIEHACYMGSDYVWDKDVNNEFGTIITLSPKRKVILEKHTSNKIIMLGPYIAYTDFSKSIIELNDEKERIGRTLMVFPSHSIDAVKMNFDFNLFINEIKEISREFDTVRICVHYSDIQRNIHLAYKQAGFQIVSAGHIYDPLFLPRLKSMLYCCDMIMSNDVGSYIGQAAYLNKPCYLYRQRLQIDEIENKDIIEEYLMRTNDKFYNDLFEIFSMPQDYLSKEQIEVINYGWGTDLVKDREELNKIIREIEDIWRKKQ